MSDLTRIWRKSPKDTAFCIVNDLGGIHFWFMEYEVDGNVNRVGGVEIHRSSAADYQRGEPHHENCWLLNGPCWHDGSSLMAQDTYIPMWERCQLMGDYEQLWVSLEILHRDHFSAPAPEQEAASAAVECGAWSLFTALEEIGQPHI